MFLFTFPEYAGEREVIIIVLCFVVIFLNLLKSNATGMWVKMAMEETAVLTLMSVNAFYVDDDDIC